MQQTISTKLLIYIEVIHAVSFAISGVYAIVAFSRHFAQLHLRGVEIALSCRVSVSSHAMTLFVALTLYKHQYALLHVRYFIEFRRGRYCATLHK